MSKMKRVLIIDDEESICRAFDRFFSRRGWSVATCATGERGLAACRTRRPSVMFLDVRLPDVNGLALLDTLQEEFPQVPVIMISAYGSLETVTQAVQGKAFDYLAKPIDLDKALALAERAVEESGPDETSVTTEQQATRIIGRSHVMQEVYKRIGLVARAEASVLIMGETGTGKELVARAIHEHGPRRDAPFIPVNCGALPDNLAESELFGYEKGAFTGADQARAGRFEAADQGTLFLDEIGELPLPLQVKLLRVLDNQTVERLGSHQPIHLDVRILAATNRDLAQDVAAGRFRSDLFYRLNVIHIALPPLRAREEDILPLAGHFRKLLAQPGKTVPSFSEGAAELLKAHDWPGNVRELRNAVEHAVVVSAGSRILAEHLPASILHPQAIGEETPRSGRLQEYVSAFRNCSEELYAKVLEPVERQVIKLALQRCRGNQTEAAELLGLHRNTLRTKLKKLGIDPGRMKRKRWP